MRGELEKLLLGAALAFVLGCHLGLGKVLPLWLAGALAALLLVLLVVAYRRQADVKIMAAVGAGLFFCCGAVVGGGAVRQPQLAIAACTGQEAMVYGTVEAGSVKTKEQGTSFVLNCTAMQLGGSGQNTTPGVVSELPATAVSKADKASRTAVAGKVRVFVKNITVGEKISGQVAVQGMLKPLTDFANPGSWDGALWNELHGVQGRMTVSGSQLQLYGGSLSLGERIAAVSSFLRRQLQAAVSGQAGAVLAGMTLGGYDGIDDQTRIDFANLGLAHLLAVSGTHIALLTGFLLLLLRRRTPYALVIVVSILLFYAALCGFKPPVLRALIMSLAFLLAGEGDRLPQRSNIFCGVILLLLCYEPRWLWDAGFQLSFATTAGLLYLYPAISGYCTRFLPVGVGEVLAVALTAQLAALPFLVHYFHQLSLVGLVANLLLVPLLEGAMLLTLAGLALLPLWGAGQLCLMVAGWLMAPLLHIIHFAAGWSWATITVGSWPWLCSAIYYLLLVLLFNSSSWDDFTTKERRLLVGLCCAALLGVGGYEKLRPQPLTVHFIDVGQGDAALVLTPQRQTLLVDCGGLRGDYDTGRRIILPYLRYLGIRSLDLLLLSHGHHDHAGGATAVAKSLPIKTIILPQERPSLDVASLLQNTGAKIVHAAAGDSYYLGNTLVQVVSAPFNNVGTDANESSLIVRVAGADGSIVFTGDATEEEELLATSQMQPAQVLKVSHHGSNNSSCTPFLTAVSPQVAVISVGAGNGYGHPGGETLHRLAASGANVWRTDLSGALKITFDAGQVKCYSYRYQKEFF